MKPLIIILSLLLAGCGGGGGGNESTSPTTPTNPPSSGNVNIFTQDQVLRNDASLVASVPSISGMTYQWNLTGNAFGAVVEGAASNLVMFSSGDTTGTIILSVDMTDQAGTTATARRTIQVVEWIVDYSNPLARVLHTATALKDGRILLVGGGMGGGSGAANPTSQLYDPTTNSWGRVPNPPVAKRGHTATLLDNGQVLIVGGRTVSEGSVLAFDSAELYDTAENAWNSAADMPVARHNHTATLLADGRVLVAGGENFISSTRPFLDSALLYDPLTDSWVSTPTLSTPRTGHAATRLKNGRVMLIGGYYSIWGGGWTDHDLATVAIFDPAIGAWLEGPSMTVARIDSAVTLLGDGRVLVVGGWNHSLGELASAEVYDPVKNTWSIAMSMESPRVGHACCLLGNGQVLVVGRSRNADMTVAELYDPASNSWIRTGSMAYGRQYLSATFLVTGEVMVAGGWDEAGIARPSAELYDPIVGAWSGAGSGPPANPTKHSATLLGNGLLLQTGGQNASGRAIASCALYDPTDNTWRPTESLNEARYRHSSVLLANGNVLVTGGSVDNMCWTPALASSEIYDPVTNIWTNSGPMNELRVGHTSTLLNNGFALVAGGAHSACDGPSNTSQLFFPENNIWTQAASMHQFRQGHTATLLNDGKVLVTGGEMTETTEIYDPDANAWTEAASMSKARWLHTATMLQNGKVLVVGGYGAGTPTFLPLSSAELYDPGTNSWNDAGSLSTPQIRHTATLLESGWVLVVGGTDSELYDPETNTWIPAGSLSFSRTEHTTTLLGNGTIIVVGGGDPTGSFYMAGTPELWRP